MNATACNAALQVEGLSATTKLVLVAIAWHADDDGFSSPSRGLLADYAMCGRATLERAIRRLQDAGLVEIVSELVCRDPAICGSGERSHTCYRLNLPTVPCAGADSDSGRVV